MAPFWGTVLAVATGVLLPVLACGGVLAALLAAGSVVPRAARIVGSGPAVAIIHVRGVILSSAGALDSSAANAQSIIKHIRDASKTRMCAPFCCASIRPVAVSLPLMRFTMRSTRLKSRLL